MPVFILTMLALAWAEPDPTAPDMSPGERVPPVEQTEESGTKSAESETPDSDKQAWERVGFGFGGVPAVNYNSDEGLGLGAIGNLFRYDGQTDPYKWSLDLQFFMTTMNVHHHRLIYDFLNVGGLPLRIFGRVKLEASRADNFCGLGDRITCDPGVPQGLADARGLTGEERETFERRYYKKRYVMPYGMINARWMFSDKPHRFEIFGGWRGNWMLPGDLAVAEPFPNTLYSDLFPTGEEGFVSVIQAGVMLDNRRNEPAPYDGYWIEASIRGSSNLWGSNPDWEYVGFNTTLRGYLPLTPNDGELVLAARVLLDGIVGDTNMQDLTWVGGSQLLWMGGGEDSLRGIRLRRFRGRVKGLNQVELRWRFARTRIFKIPFDFGVLSFHDTGMTAENWADLGRMRPYWGTGGGLRITMDQSFVIRADVGVSPVERWSPGVYISLGNLF
ncbi:MAG: hypothetical protein EA397_16235 [Deltaproteobacteria bacterium]|nr:MAG: hypothetical protein EA397_16235 [Deltaproteobacteria bacterium]